MTTAFVPARTTSAALLSSRRVTLEEWLAIPEEHRAELIDGKLVYQALPGPRHGRTQSRIISSIDDAYDRRAGEGERPGGWWLSLEVDLDVRGFGCRPDVLGWRRDRYPTLPRPDAHGLVSDVPDWICEVLSRSTAAVDLGAKRRAYHEAGVAHYWIADPQNRTLTVLRRADDDYLVVLAAGLGEAVRAEPFGAVDIDVTRLFDEDGEVSDE